MSRSQTIQSMCSFWPPQAIAGGIQVESLLCEIKTFALQTFDKLDVDGNGFLSADELARVVNLPNLSKRENSYIRFLLTNINKISLAYDDGDGISPCGISRNDIYIGISRNDLVAFFEKV